MREPFVPEIPASLRDLGPEPPLPPADATPWARVRWINDQVAWGRACAVTHAATLDLLDAAAAGLKAP